jgi:uncharacterized membrane protein (UPF0127 family)
MNSRPAAAGRRPVLWLWIPLCLLACAGSGRAPGKPQTGLPVKTITIEKASGGSVTVEAEVARTEEERGTGLMFRAALEDGRGMLFVFDRDEVLSFWMKDTFIPLSIAYIGYDGTIIDIRDMRPRDTRAVRSSRSVRYALEVPQGWFGRAGIRPGDRAGGF